MNKDKISLYGVKISGIKQEWIVKDNKRFFSEYFDYSPTTSILFNNAGDHLKNLIIELNNEIGKLTKDEELVKITIETRINSDEDI